jgi:hypothetical protein
MSMKRNPIRVKVAAVLPAAVLLLLVAGTVPVLGAGPVFWDWPADRPFDEMQLEGAALDPEGNLTAGLLARTGGPEGPEVFWSILADGRGGFYTGTGHGGEIHHTDAKDRNRMVARLEGSEVFSLLQLDGGDLLAGCGPEGQLYRVKDDGEVTLLGNVPGGYVWALVPDPSGDGVWMATGSPAAVYRYDFASGALENIADLPAQNALDLWVDGEGDLLVSTQGPGLIYHLDGGGSAAPRLLYETVQDEARQFIQGPAGDLFVLALETGSENQPGNGMITADGSAGPPPALLSLMMGAMGPEIPRAALYRLQKDGPVVPWWSGDVELMIAAWSPRWGWVGGGPLADESGRTQLHGLTIPAGNHPVAGWQGGDILDMLVTGEPGKDETIVVCQAHPGGLAFLRDKGDTPLYAMSPSLDGGLPVRWGRLNWTTDGKGGSLKWSVRGGNRAEPDDSWTAWTGSWTGQNEAIGLEPSRFLQWRVEFPAAGSADDFRLTSVSISAWQDNLAPMITAFAQEYLKDIHLGMMNNHNDHVTQTFRSGLQAEFSTNSTANRLAGPERSAVGRSARVFTWDGVDPNGDRVVYDLEYRRTGDSAWRAIVTDRQEHLGSWDTSEVADGQYDVRLTASDHPDNPGHLAARSSRNIGPVSVDNTEPEITKFSVVAREGGFEVNLTARDAQGVLARAWLRLPDGTSERLDPVDGICDSPTEKFSTEVVWPRPGREAGERPWRLRVDVQDMGGNTAFLEGDVP